MTTNPMMTNSMMTNPTKQETNKSHSTERLFNIPRVLALVIIAWAALVVFTLTSAPAHAGQTCEEKPPTVDALRSGLNLGAKVRDQLDASNAEVVLIARVGQDLSKYNLKHSHLAFLVRNMNHHLSSSSAPAEKWTVFHMLNQCGKTNSSLFAEGLGMFFMDAPFRYEAMVITPSPALQARLKTVLVSDLLTRFKANRYNMLAYPFNPASQNSNQWVLEVLAAAISQERPILSREDAEAYLQYVGFQPSVIHLDTLTRLGATLTKQNINFNDHPFGKRMAGRIETVTVESVEKFLKRRDPEMTVQDFSL